MTGSKTESKLASTITPTTGPAPLTVAFQDTSTGGPTSWSWSFGDGAISAQRNPGHTYTAPGTYTVTLTARNAGGANTVTRTNLITAVMGVTLNPAADVYVSITTPFSNFGTATTLRVRRRDEQRSYMRFSITGLTGTVTAARLRLWVAGSADAGGTLHRLPGGTWTETGITYANAPSVNTPALGTAGPVTASTWLEFALPAGTITGNGTHTFVLRNTAQSGGTAAAIYSSRQAPAANRPQLVIDTR